MLDDIEVILRNKASDFGTSTGASMRYTYSSDKMHGGSISKEFLPYQERKSTNAKIIALFDNRKQIWDNDKMVNPLVAIPGSPGSGKSTFLVHFPESEEYKKYSNNSAIVSAITFNGGMTSRIADTSIPIEWELHLRMIYGSCLSMQWFNKLYTWDMFLLDCSRLKCAFSRVSGIDILIFLRRLFGKDRPILLLVDELAKLKDDKIEERITSMIGNMLDNDVNFDCVLSALSPNYIYKLVTPNSQREIKYVVLPSLLDSTLGKEECRVWADKLTKGIDSNLERLNTSRSLKKMCLKNAYILASGQPRVLQIVLGELDVKDFICIKNNYANDNKSVAELILEICSTFKSLNSLIGQFPNADWSLEAVEKFIFSSPSKTDVKDEQFRKLIESGEIFAFKEVDTAFVPAVKTSFVLRLLKRLQTTPVKLTGLLKEVKEIFYKFHKKDISTWFELIVATTIISRSYSLNSIDEIMSVDLMIESFDDNPEISVRRGLMPLNETCPLPALWLSPDRNPGYDFMVYIPASSRSEEKLEDLFFYGEVKCLPSSSADKNPVDILFKKIHITLTDHLDNRTVASSGNPDCFANVHIVFYLWGYQKAVSIEAIGRSDFSALVTSICAKCSVPREQAEEHLSNFLKTNVHQVCEPQLRDWLIPSFLPIPLLLEEMQTVDDSNSSP